jgi:ketosteroid isomerase-like protein
MEQWVKDYYQAYQDALARGDSQAIASSCSEDCVLIPPGRAPFKGREAIANFYNRPPSAPIDLDLDRVVIMGDTALVQGMGHWDEDGKRRSPMFFVAMEISGYASFALGTLIQVSRCELGLRPEMAKPRPSPPVC